MIPQWAEPIAPASSLRTAARLAWSVWALAIALAGLGIVFLALSYSTPIPVRWGPRGFPAVAALVSSTVGALIVSNRPRHPIGWIFAWFGLLSGAQVLLEEYRVYALLTMGGSLPAGEISAWIANWIWLPAIAPAITLLFLLFPTGRLLSPAWRPVAWLAAIIAAASTLIIAFTPGPFEQFGYLNNPFGIEALGSLGRSRSPLAFIPLMATVFACVVSLILRIRRSAGEEREQLKWFVYAAVLVALALPAGFAYHSFPAGPILLISAMALTQVAVGVAILKYRLYDIDLIINRTLVYGSLTIASATVYFAGVAVLQAGFRAITGQDSPLAVVLSTLTIAALFNPLRGRFQSAIDRRFYRSNYDASRILSAFSAHARDEVEVSRLSASLIEAADQAMQPTTITLWLRDSGEPSRQEPISHSLLP